jgi:hypothetical protein
MEGSQKHSADLNGHTTHRNMSLKCPLNISKEDIKKNIYIREMLAVTNSSLLKH